MDHSHFYEDSSEDEMQKWEDNSDISFNPWATSKRSSSRATDNRISLTSFRFASHILGDVTLSPAQVKPAPKIPPKSPQRSKKVLRSVHPVVQQNGKSVASSAHEDDLQGYVQTLLQGSITEGVHQEMDLYQDCLTKRPVQPPRFLSVKPTLASRERSIYNKDNRRISVMSTASDASAVPSLIFSDADMQTRTISNDVQAPASKTFHRNSIISLSSINTVASNRSWFMDDESLPSSPVEPVQPTRRSTFTRGVELGISCFDDGDDDDEEKEQGQIKSSESFCFPLMGAETSHTSNNRRKPSPGLTIKTAPTSKNSPNSLSPSLPPLTHSPISPRASPICASPNRRRSRRRTASSECIVLEALEKMNAVMYEFANEDINRKSVVGLDLPGNQVSVEAYGELWW